MVVKTLASEPSFFFHTYLFYRDKSGHTEHTQNQEAQFLDRATGQQGQLFSHKRSVKDGPGRG